jgi:MtN3 and saliva related transmembrane protein
MEYSLETIICSVAATLTTISFLPQSIKTIKAQNADGVSFWMYLLFVSGVLLWIVAGFVMNNYPIIIANIITFFLSGSVLLIKIRSHKKSKK